VATITTRMCAHAGEAWRLALVDWETFVTADNWENAFAVSATTESGLRALLTVFIIGDEYFEGHYLIADLLNTEVYAPMGLSVLPGWQDNSFPIPEDVGEDGGHQYWLDYIAYPKRLIGLTLTGTLGAGDFESDWVPTTGGLHAYLRTWAGVNDKGCYLDCTSVTTTTSDPTIAASVEGGLDAPVVGAPLPVMLAPGLGSDIKRIADYLERLAYARFDISINNGAVVVTAASETLIT